jgi:hypothetical protein
MRRIAMFAALVTAIGFAFVGEAQARNRGGWGNGWQGPVTRYPSYGSGYYNPYRPSYGSHYYRPNVGYYGQQHYFPSNSYYVPGNRYYYNPYGTQLNRPWFSIYTR